MTLGVFRGLKDRLDRLFGRGVVDDQLFEDLEEALLGADVGLAEASAVLEELRERARKERVADPERIRALIKEIVTRRLAVEEAGLRILKNLVKDMRHLQFHQGDVLQITVESKPLR